MTEFLLPTSLGLCGVICVLQGRSFGAQIAGLLLAIVFVSAVWLGATSLAWQATLSALPLMLIRAEWVWARRIAVATVALFVLTAVAVNQAHEDRVAAREQERLAWLRERYPPTSVAERLEYETRNQHQPANGDAETAPRLAADVERELVDNEFRFETARRRQSLLRIIRPAASGVESLGLRRSSYYAMDDVEVLPELRTISLSQLPERRGCGPAEPLPSEYVPTPSPGEQKLPLIAMRQYHREAAQDFLDPERFGFVEDREHVVGFDPHAFHRVPSLQSHNKHEAALKLEHLDLVGLHKPSGPLAYVSENYPRLDELKTADTRLLHDFETRALAQLRTEDDVVIEEVEGSVRMLGALRAGNDCRRCHAMQRGELIGALSYEFVRKTATPNPQIAGQ